MIDYEKLKPSINEFQLKTLKTIKSYLNDCHHLDLLILHNGIDLQFEADFLKYILLEIDCDRLHEAAKSDRADKRIF